MSKHKEVWVLGFALFAMFFGAGNLIFPPSLGANTGTNWIISSIGFLITGVGLPLLGVLSFTKYTTLEEFAAKVSPRFNTIFCSVLILVIGPLFALPRTGSVTFELAVLPFLQETSLVAALISSIIFFTIVYVITIKESKITDITGKYLTPIILVILALIFIKGMVGSLGTPITTQVTENLFSYGFINGYQTMDALASILFGIIIVHNLRAKGITEQKEQQYYLVRAGIIASVGLGSIYLFLIYFGALVSGADLSSTSSVALYISEATLGTLGRSIFGICVGAACLTTAVGLTALTAEWFSKILNMSYSRLVLITVLFATVIAIGGVDMIIKLSIPMLLLLYPITIVLILMNIVGLKAIYFKLGAYTTTVVSALEMLGATFDIAPLKQLVSVIPLGSMGFVWVLPFCLSLVVAYIWDCFITSKKTV
ncbi:MAG: branched-chain amino acid transport system II carrier protein [Brevinema sp.]